MVGKPSNRKNKSTGDGWSMRGPKLKLRHVAALRAGKWVGSRANTRVPAFMLALGYPATVIFVPMSPWVLFGCGFLAAVVIWNLAYRSVVRPGEHATKGKLSMAAQWATRVTLLLVAYLGWLFLIRWQVQSAPVGTGILSMLRKVKVLFLTVFDGRWFFGYCVGAVACWLLVFNAQYVVTRHRERRAAESNPFTQMDDFDGARMVSQKETKIGHKYRFDITGTGKGQSEFSTTAIKERIAAKLRLPASRVLIKPVGKNAALVDIETRERDPWETELVHPQAPDYRQGRAKITDPIVLGMEPTEGLEIILRLVTKEGGQHVVVVAGTRGGKTTLVNSIIEKLTRPRHDLRDTDVIMIDVTKGKDGRAWAPAVAESYMGPENTENALLALERYAKLIDSRSAVNRDAVWKVGTKPDRRAKVIVLDEASALLGEHVAPVVRDRAKAAVSYIMTKGASELVILIVMAQRGVLAHLGTADTNTQAFVKIILGLSKSGEMSFLVPGWEAEGMPDMAKYGEGRKGVALVVPVGQGWSAGRTWNLSDLDTIRKIAADRVIPDPVHRAILAAEVEYARRHPDPGATDPEVKAAEAERAEADPDPEVTDMFSGDPDPVTLADPLTFEPPADGVNDPDDPDLVPGAPWGSPTPQGQGQPPAPSQVHERLAMSWGRPSGSAGYRAPNAAKFAAARDAAQAAASTGAAAVRVTSRKPVEQARAEMAIIRQATRQANQGKEVPASFTGPVFEHIVREGSISRTQAVQVTGLQKSRVFDYLSVLVDQGKLSRTGAGAATRYERP